MKSIVIFYSRTGTTRKAGLEIAKSLGCDSEEILDTAERKGLIGYMRSGKESTQRKLTNLRPMQNDVSKYDLVIIGTPIWAWNMSSPVRTFITENKGMIKKAAFFCTMGRSGAEKAFREMAGILGKKPASTLALTTKEVMAGDISEKTVGFTKTFKSIKGR